jgi:hypothetical protein
MPNDRGEQILAGFPGPVTVRTVLTLSRGLFIAGSMLFAIACLWGAWYWYLNDSDSSKWLGLGSIATLFAGFAVALAVTVRTNRMTLDREGFEIVNGTVFGLRKGRFRWREVSAFERVRIGANTYGIGFDDARKGGSMFLAVNRSLGFRNSTLIEDYGLGDNQLAELLNRWRDLALATGTADRESPGPRATAR